MVVVGCQPLAGESMRWIKCTVTGLTNLHDAAARNKIGKMRKHLSQGGVDVNRRNKLGDTPLHEACAYIRDNGDSSKTSKKGRRSRQVAKDRRKVGKKLSRRQLGEGGALEMLELLVNAGSDINAQNIVGDAPLHKAALNGRARSVDFLIRAGANVNIRNEFAQTPLHAACVSGNIEVVQRLVQGGADTSAQDAAEDTPFYEACRHQYEGIVIYLMGLANNPETSQGLKLWQGLDPSWEKVLRDRAQAQVEDAEDRSEKPATVSVSTAAAAAGLSSVRLGISTPSTTHNSLRSSESAMGLGLANRTPVRQGQFATTGGSKDRGGVIVSITGCEQGKKMASSSPSALRARGGGGGGGGDARKRSAESGAAGAGGTGASSDGACFNSTGGSRPGSATRRRRRDGGDESVTGHTRTFSTGAAEVLDWQATKAKSTQQERLIDKAREALREEQNEAAMALSSTTLGDDDASVDTANTADTPTTIGSRSSRPRSQRVPSCVSPAAAAAAAGLDGEGSVPSGSRMGKTPSRDRAAAAATAAVEGAPPGEGRAKTVSPVMPTPPRSEVNVDTLVPPREDGRRQSARKSRSQVVMLKSPAARVARRSSGGGGFSKSNTVDGSGSSRRFSRRSGAPRTSSDHRPDAGGRDRDAERSSHRSSGGRSSRTSAEHEGHGHVSSSSANVADSVGRSSRPRSSRRKEGEGAPLRENGDGGAGGRGERRSPSSRRERHRHREGGDAETSGRSSPRLSGTGRKGYRSSRGQEEGHPSESGGSSGRRRESKRQSRSSHEGAASAADTAHGDAAGAVSTPVAALAQAVTPAPGAAAARAAAAASGHREVPSSVVKAIKASHEARTPRMGDSLSAHFMTHGTPSRTSDGRPTPSKSREGRATPLRTNEAREGRTPSGGREERTPGASSTGPGREGKTPKGSSSGSRPSAKAPKQRSGGRDLRPLTLASRVSPGLEEPSSRKKVIASDLPVRRVSPYNTRKQELLGAGGPARARPASKQFITSPGRSAASASRPVAKTIDIRGHNDNDSCCGSSFDPAGKGKGKADVSGVSAAASRPPAKTIDLRGDRDNDSCCGSSNDPAGRGDIGSDGRPAVPAAKITSRQKSPPRTPTLSGDEDFPPLIDALMMSKGGAAANGDSSQCSERTHKGKGIENAKEKEKESDKSEERVVSPTASRPSKITEVALANSKSLLFSDSDSDNDRSSSGEASQQRAAAASTFGTAESIAALSAVSKVFRQGRDTDDAAAGAAASSVVFNPGRKADDAGASATAAVVEAATPPPPPPPASSSSATVSAEAAPRAEAPAPSAPRTGLDSTGRLAVDGPAVTGTAAAQAARGKNSIVEPSAAPRVSVQALSSTSTSHASTKAGRPAAGLSATATAVGVGGARGRPSGLGRPGMAPAKVSMPIVGGRAAWNKFLASTAPGGESAPDAPGASTTDASADGGGQGTDADASAEGSGGFEEGDSTADPVEEQDEFLAARGPRGFKSAADSQEGPNKGPAGAFSGNAMWRLAAGASSAANRTKSGVAANGHGGYSNPLAAMRAGGNGAAAGGGADETAMGGGVANPLAGLRGAASMGGTGTANPLARARGRGARPGGAGGTANPLARPPTVSGGLLSPGPSGSAAAKEPAMPSGGVTASAAANAEDEGRAAAAAGAEGVASTSTPEGGTKRAAIDGAIDLDRPTEFRAIGNHGSWQKGGRIPIPPRRPTRAEPQVEADPGQAKVGGLVMALQNPDDPRFGPMLKDLKNKSGSTSSLTVLDRKGLVSLHRAKYSPRPPGPGMADSNGLDA